MKDIELVKDCLSRESRLIQLPAEGRVVFIGDTHGDFDATEKVFRHYFIPGYILVFLGDYVDRGDESRKNLEFLLTKKLEAPERLHLLAGNHEGYCKVPFSPADFWESLSEKEYAFYSEICSLFSFAATTKNGVIGVHGAPPDIMTPEDINTIKICSDQWFQLTWGDFAETEGELTGNHGGRPVFGEDYFNRTMKQLGKNVLIRSHQPRIEPVVFGKRCLTLMTSYSYTFNRHIAIVDLEKPTIHSVDDIEIVEI